MARISFFAVLSLASASPFQVGHDFKEEVNEAIANLRRILDEERQPRFPADVPHSYEDKYLLAELATSAAAASVVQLLLMMDTSPLPAVSRGLLGFSSCVSCSFLRTEEKEVQVGQAQVQETETMLGTWRSTQRSKTKVQEHFWNWTSQWRLFLVNSTLASGHKGSQLKSLGDVTEAPTASGCQDAELDISWLLRLRHRGAAFLVNRSRQSCRTPRRNEEVQEAVSFFQRLTVFARRAVELLRGDGSSDWAAELEDARKASVQMFKPILALFALENNASGRPVLSADVDTVLDAYQKSLDDKLHTIERSESGGLARLVLLLTEMESLSLQMMSAVDALEGMLYQQLTSALGKSIHSSDFGEYMDFHGRMILGDAYAPAPFVYAVRRHQHHPEGTLSIEAKVGTGASSEAPLRSFALHLPEGRPMRVELSSATSVTLTGEHYLHAAIFHRFAKERPQELQLHARARQLSSFVLMVGKIAAPDRFEPTAALIIQNKDDLAIPLLLETVPTPKEFIDSIQSLSPEQQRFAKAWRKMQLSSSLFAVCVVQIKPLLEKVLNLPEFSLTKEIQLTQDLIELFVKYQVPPDLMSYDGGGARNKAGEVLAGEKLDQVKSHVAKLWDTISQSRKKQLQEKQEEAKMRNMQSCGAEECPRSDADRGEWPMFSYSMEAAEMKGDVYSAAPQTKKAARSVAREAAVESVRLTAARAPSPAPKPPDAGRRLKVETGRDAPPKEPATAPAFPRMEGSEEGGMDYTQLPHLLDANYLKFDTEAKLRPTTIKLGPLWTKQEQPGFLGALEKRQLDAGAQRTETQQAFDLLDALSRSGAMTLDQTSLHVVLAATHCFDETVIDTAVKQNDNPIEKLERSMLIVASTIHRKAPSLLLRPPEVERIRSLSPALFEPSAQKKLF